MFSAPVTKPNGTKAHNGNSFGAKRLRWRRNSVSSTKNPISTCTSSLGISWNSHSPSATPNGISRLKRMISGHARCLRNSQRRQVLEASCTTPCAGIAAAGGMNSSISAINIVPPPEVRAEVNNAAPTSNAMSVQGIL